MLSFHAPHVLHLFGPRTPAPLPTTCHWPHPRTRPRTLDGPTAHSDGGAGLPPRIRRAAEL